MGEALGARLVPMTFYVSPAERAQQTFRAVQRNWKGLKKRHGVTTPALYTFDYREVLDWISRQPDELERVALVGHNPAFTDLVNYFLGPDTLENLPTVGWAELVLPIDNWSQAAASEGQGELVYLLFPKELGGAD
jgi:phosphohistidine phosphatase